MTRVTLVLPIMALAAISACSDGTGTERFLIDPPTSATVTEDQLGATELREVSLPDYAAADEVPWQTADGIVRSSSGKLWADDPQRAFTITLARAISEISGAAVIPEPWPLASPPQRKLDVRVEKALAANDGFYRLKGRYFISDESNGGAGTSHTRSFDIAVPINEAEPKAIAQAMSQAITLLAEQIAQIGGPGTTIIAEVAPAPSVDPLAALPPLEPLF